MTLKSYRELDLIKLEAQAAVVALMQEFERTLMGKRAPQVFEEEDDAGISENESEEQIDNEAEDDSQGYENSDGAPGR